VRGAPSVRRWDDGGGLKKVLAPRVLAASHTRRGRGESPSTLVTPAQNTGARNIHERRLRCRSALGEAEDRAPSRDTRDETAVAMRSSPPSELFLSLR